jgi:hypothetical protein
MESAKPYSLPAAARAGVCSPHAPAQTAAPGDCSIQAYRAFIASRANEDARHGFVPKPINDMAKVHQVRALEFALDRGKSAACFWILGLARALSSWSLRASAQRKPASPRLF